MPDLFQKLKNIYHLLQAIAANAYYGFPANNLKVIGVTGTDGKTTTTHLIYHILKSAGKKVSMISSVYAEVGNKVYDTGFHVTTPDLFALFKFLKISADSHDEYFVLEVTSHALDQNRVFGIAFAAAVVTNITHEHLDYHKTYENYVEVKTKLLTSAKTTVVNKDDRSFSLLKTILTKNRKKFQTFGFNSKDADFRIDLDSKATLFNKYNFLAAYSVCRLLGISDQEIKESLVDFKLPQGRLHLVYDKNFKVMIDFAHTPNALDQLLGSLKKQYLKNAGRLIHVFGSAGLRDISKRPIMGEMTAQYSDVVILTEEDYRTEDPLSICKQIAEGVLDSDFKEVGSADLNNQSRKVYAIILDRQQAINTALKIAGKNDIVVLTGKGHEKSLARGKTEFDWNEEKAVKIALKKLK